MTCTAPAADKPAPRSTLAPAPGADDELLLASRSVGDWREACLSVPGMRCGGCMNAIETALSGLPGMVAARANLSTRRVTVRWQAGGPPPPLVETLAGIGFARLHDANADKPDDGLAELIRALAVAGFAASNIMLLSVSVWSGADATTRHVFHWLSAAIALPALAYSGRVFFRSAWRALKHGRTNMDVPISLGVLLAFAMSLYDTVLNGPYAYFDAAVSLLFFLLIGRTLDHRMRDKARAAVKGLARLAARGALVEDAFGKRRYVAVEAIEPGMVILLAAGERVPVDGEVRRGRSDLDRSLVTGEAAPQPVAAGALLQAGTLNLTGPITIVARAAAQDSFLAEIVRLMEAAEAGRSGYRRLADRAARLYAPAIHLTALISFLGWMAATGGDWHRALTIAVAVLIITCPCALGLAVPMVQVMAARRLFDAGIMVKDGSGLERLAEIDSVVFDKTGTLTLGHLRLADADTADAGHLAIAASMAGHSRHPLCQALLRAGGQTTGANAFDQVSEQPGLGVEAQSGATRYRLGRAEWALAGASASVEAGAGAGAGARAGADGEAGAAEPGTVLACDGVVLARFAFADCLRPGAAEAIAELQGAGLAVEVLSGDRPGPVGQLAGALGVARFEAGVLPGDKAAHVAALAAAGAKVLMVGDGLNDAPALAAAHASMAPANAADVGRNAADFVFLRDSLAAVPLAVAIARAAARLVKQNFALAVAYNAVAVPFAVLGYVTPLIAALAMSLSSLTVVANALRLKGGSLASRSLGAGPWPGRPEAARRAAANPAAMAMEPGQ